MTPKDVERMANRVDPYQTAPYEQSDQNLHCLLRHTCPTILNFYGTKGGCIFTWFVSIKQLIVNIFLVFAFVCIAYAINPFSTMDFLR